MILHRDNFHTGYESGGKGWHLFVWKNTKQREDGPQFGWSAEVQVPYNGGRTLLLIEGGQTRAKVVAAVLEAMRKLGMEGPNDVP